MYYVVWLNREANIQCLQKYFSFFQKESKNLFFFSQKLDQKFFLI